MKIRPILARLDTSEVFKTVRFSRDLPELKSFKDEELPAVYLLPSSVRGGVEGGDISLQQEAIEVYSFAVITKAPTPTGTDEPLDDALSELRRLLFGFQPDPQVAPFAIGEGDLIDFNPSVNAWLETFVTRRTYRS
jgi:hypothetical protein